MFLIVSVRQQADITRLQYGLNTSVRYKIITLLKLKQAMTGFISRLGD